MLAGGTAVIEQDKQYRLPVHIDGRLSESFCQVNAPRTNPNQRVGMTPRVRGL